MKLIKVDGVFECRRCEKCGRNEDVLITLNEYNLCPYCNREMFPNENIMDED